MAAILSCRRAEEKDRMCRRERGVKKVSGYQLYVEVCGGE
jgi:hypothetical protein